MARLCKEMSTILNKDVLDNLQLKKIYTILDFLQEDPEKLAAKTVLSYTEIVTLRQTFTRNYGAFAQNALQLYNDILANSALLSTGISGLDTKLLNGGLFTGQLTEIYGVSCSGKTQMCLSISTHVAHTLKQRVYYFDAKNDFSGTRMQAMLEARGAQEEDMVQAMERVQVVRPTSVTQLLMHLPQLQREMQHLRDNNVTTRLVIVDSLPALLYQFNDCTASQAKGMLFSLGAALKQLAWEMHVSVLLVNLAVRWSTSEHNFESPESSSGGNNSMKAAFGSQWLSFPSTRLSLVREEDSSKMTVEVTKSTHLPHGRSCVLHVTEKGIETC